MQMGGVWPKWAAFEATIRRLVVNHSNHNHEAYAGYMILQVS